MRTLVAFIYAPLLASLLFLAGCTTSTGTNTGTDTSKSYTLYLIRHAEKVADGSKNPDLTLEGVARAITLATRLQDKGIRDIWSSDYQRTRETAAPLANELGIKIRIYNPKQQGELLEHLQKRQRNALVVGHSNTIPELAAMICDCEVLEMEETEYDRLIVIRMTDGKAELQTLSQSELMGDWSSF